MSEKVTMLSFLIYLFDGFRPQFHPPFPDNINTIPQIYMIADGVLISYTYISLKLSFWSLTEYTVFDFFHTIFYLVK